jgi:glycosyltransferase involved in cell wall biosynthesis
MRAKIFNGPIFLIIGSLASGGAETQLVRLAQGLRSRGWEVVVLALTAQGPLLDPLRRSGISVVNGGYLSGSVSKAALVVTLLRAEVRFVLAILRHRPKVVQGYLPLGNFLAAVAGRITRTPLVITSKRALGTHQERRPGLKWMDWFANNLSHIITANSSAVADDTSRRDGVNPRKIVVIPNGLDAEAFQRSSSERKMIRSSLGLAPSTIALGMVANLIPYKGHAELIDAMAVLVARYPNIALLLIGEDRGIGEQLRARTKALGVEDQVIFTGGRADVPALLSALDIGVMASHEEGFSNALLEKLAAGLPIVATEVGGNPEALEGMPGCLLVPPKDTAALVAGISQLVDNLPTMQAFAEERRLQVQQRYATETMIAAYEALYRRYRVDTSR